MIRPLVVPPTLTLPDDAVTKGRLHHARALLDQWNQQDVAYPLHLQVLRLTPKECASLVGEAAWTEAYQGNSPTADQPLPRGLIGILIAALRQLEVDLAAQTAAAQAAHVISAQLMAAHATAGQTAAELTREHASPPEVGELKRRKTGTGIDLEPMEEEPSSATNVAAATAATAEAAAVPVKPLVASGTFLTA